MTLNIDHAVRVARECLGPTGLDYKAYRARLRALAAERGEEKRDERQCEMFVGGESGEVANG